MVEAYSETESHWSENETVSVHQSISSAQQDELEDLERLANNIFGQSEDEGCQFHCFYQDQTVQDVL